MISEIQGDAVNPPWKTVKSVLDRTIWIIKRSGIRFEIFGMSSLLAIISLQELTRKTNELTVTVYRPLEIYTVLVLEYLVLILIVSWMVRRLEDRLGANVQGSHR
jgi:polar amino acid transport system permease protein